MRRGLVSDDGGREARSRAGNCEDKEPKKLVPDPAGQLGNGALASSHQAAVVWGFRLSGTEAVTG